MHWLIVCYIHGLLVDCRDLRPGDESLLVRGERATRFAPRGFGLTTALEGRFAVVERLLKRGKCPAASCDLRDAELGLRGCPLASLAAAGAPLASLAAAGALAPGRDNATA